MHNGDSVDKMDFLPMYSFLWAVLENNSQFFLQRLEVLNYQRDSYNFSSSAFILSVDDK